MNRNYPEFHAICKAVGVNYKEAVLEFTDGRTESLRALTDGEYKELYLRARKWQPAKRPEDVKEAPKFPDVWKQIDRNCWENELGNQYIGDCRTIE